MKTKQIFSILLLAAVLLVSSVSSFGQCNKKKYCAENMGDFDYNSQSSYALLSPGDTTRANVVLYANQTYRIYVCGAADLGQIEYKIVLPERKTVRKISSIKKDTVVTYKKDPETGDIIYDNFGSMVVESKKVVMDTTYVTERYQDESNVLFDSKKGKPYLEYTPKKAGRLIVKIQVPSGDPEDEDCVNVYVGRRMVGSKSFKAGSHYTDN